MEKISLMKLNREGILIAEVKKNAFIMKEKRMPCMFRKGDSSTCYLHYYNDMYYVTLHIATTLQMQYYKFEDAQTMIHEFFECIKD